MSADSEIPKITDTEVVRELTFTQRIILIVALCSIAAAVITRLYMNGQLFPGHARVERSRNVEIRYEKPKEIVVDVKGAVRYPGVYRLPDGSRVDNAIRAAGGVERSANTQAMNLAEKLKDGRQIIVPGADSVEKAQIADKNIHPSATKNKTVTNVAPALHSININTADIDELDRLPGIGEASAKRIIKLRGIRGPFRSVEELMLVDGIGESALKKLSPYILIK